MISACEEVREQSRTSKGQLWVPYLAPASSVREAVTLTEKVPTSESEVADIENYPVASLKVINPGRALLSAKVAEYVIEKAQAGL